MTLHTYLIEPQAPLVIRTGRPFDGQAGADAARFPPPSTLAGALRTAHATSTGLSFSPELAQLAVAGPLPVVLGDTMTCLVPQPADALYVWNEDKTQRKLVRVAPQALSRGEGCDLPHGLLPVQLTERVQSKPAGGPRWWALDDLNAWRHAGTAHGGASPNYEQIQQRGWSPLPDEVRTHVAIDEVSQAAASGRLFQTAGLSFWGRSAPGRFPEQRVGLVGRIAGEIEPGLITLGGERRLSAITPAPVSLWPVMPADLVARIEQAGGLTLTLLTPALFSTAWRPPEIPGLTLVAAALGRWQPHSGWDLAKQQPRAGRKLVPAGAVYWYRLTGAADLAALWLAPLADQEQDRRDGFGLAVPHPWTPT